MIHLLVENINAEIQYANDPFISFTNHVFLFQQAG